MCRHIVHVDGSYNAERGGFVALHDIKSGHYDVMKIPDCQDSRMAERMAILRGVLHARQSHIPASKFHILSDAKNIIETGSVQEFIKSNHLGGGSWVPRECNTSVDALFTIHNMNQASCRCNKGMDDNHHRYLSKAYGKVFG